jgi:hypothetical protein
MAPTDGIASGGTAAWLTARRPAGQPGRYPVDRLGAGGQSRRMDIRIQCLCIAGGAPTGPGRDRNNAGHPPSQRAANLTTQSPAARGPAGGSATITSSVTPAAQRSGSIAGSPSLSDTAMLRSRMSRRDGGTDRPARPSGRAPQRRAWHPVKRNVLTVSWAQIGADSPLFWRKPSGCRRKPSGCRRKPPGRRPQPPGCRRKPPGRRPQPPGRRRKPPGRRLRPASCG